MTLDTFRRQALAALTAYYGPEEAQAVVRRWLGSRMKAEPHELLLRRAQQLEAPLEAILTDDLNQLVSHVPLQYVLGWQPFYGLDLEVGPGVLIPRPETEELVLRTLRLWPGAPGCAVDIGTGSGAIALAMKQAWPLSEVTGIDVSEEALGYARRNGKRLGLEVTWHLGDMATWQQWPAWQPQLIISNPPYVPPVEAPTLQPHVHDHEPHLALFTPTPDATLPYRHIMQYATAHLAPGGYVALELHPDTAVAVAALFSTGAWQCHGPEADAYGRLRYLWAQKRAN